MAWKGMAAPTRLSASVSVYRTGGEFRLEFRLNFRKFPEIFQRKFGSSGRLQREKHRQAQRGDAGVSGAA